ncbi:hypothetical protein E1A91_D10G017400v1 [Gossypium mustelinum]|uniref:Late embryogenesis abundant protein LEA-2 subgroup domain-containing protein n=1 Tax=Gossypium mustelinum TaxID=34275 RepID=A0A5D2T3E8_GOSMU|nr:hypothetical protein E1A91_D10G017400v1 [Gossypium mustelinum]
MQKKRKDSNFFNMHPSLQILPFHSPNLPRKNPSPIHRKTMSSSDRLPIQDTRPQPQPVKHHHSARYYAQRVRESFTTRVTKVLCAIFLSFLLVALIVFFIVWLSLRPHRPRFHMIDFTVPGLAQKPGLDNAVITFNVTARNSNQHIGIYYDSMEGFVYYKDKQIGSTPLLHPFFQEPKTTTVVYGQFGIGTAMLAVNSRRWKEFVNDRQHGTVHFRLGIMSVIRFKVSTWKSVHRKMHVNCDVAVGSDGLILPAWKNRKCSVYFS